MKNRRAFLFAVICGLAAVILTSVYIYSKESYYSSQFKELPVLVAAHDIKQYEVINETMLQVQAVPKPFQQPTAVLRDQADEIMGYVAIATIKKGEQITATKLSLPSETRISNNIEKKERACTLAVNEITGVAGLIRPSDHVDVIGIFRTVDEKTRAATEAEAVTLFQNIPVLAVGRNYAYDRPEAEGRDKGLLGSSAGTNFSNLTFSMTPRQCMDLALAQQVGTISIALRSISNRLGGETFKVLYNDRSSVASVTGIKSPLEISNRPKWIELRGEQAILAP